MKILLDTQTWLWMMGSSGRLSATAREQLADRSNELLLSAASSWEIAIKHALGKLTLPEEPASYVPNALRRSRVHGLSVEHVHALHVSTLPQHHRDPVDRLLVAQAQLEGLSIMTSDPAFDLYDVDVVAADKRSGE